MGAQLTLFPVEGDVGVDSPRSLAGDFQTTNRNSVFWMPAFGMAEITLANSSPSSIFVKLRCGSLNEDFVVPAMAAAVREIHAGLNGDHDSEHAVSCDITSDGAVSALRPVGIVTAPGYSAPIRFYDPATATFQSLTAVGLETGGRSYVTVHNVTAKPVLFTPILREATLKPPFTQTLPSITLAPYASAEVHINDLLPAFLANGISRVTLTLKTSADKGSFIGAVTQVSAPDQLVEDIPLRTSNPPATARGSYPLRWDGDYTNAPAVTNTADEVLGFGGTITAGGMTYVLTHTTIDPGGTIVVDVDKLRRDQTPDVNGKTLPKEALFGKFHWIELSNGTKAGLLGRTSLSSVANRRKSSFSCGNSCQFSYVEFPYYSPSVFIDGLGVGSNQISNMTTYMSEVNGGSYVYPLDYNSNGGLYGDDNGSVMSPGPDPQSTTNMVITGIAADTSNMYYQLDYTNYSMGLDYGSCVSDNEYIYKSGTTTVTPACPSTVTVSTIINPSLPSSRFPSALTGIGILSRMLVSPSVTNYAGTQLVEAVTPTFNSCPSNIQPYTSFPPLLQARTHYTRLDTELTLKTRIFL